MNQQQREAITTTEGPLLVMAGAGSGKTRVLTHRIAYLIEEKQISPWRILAITFTNKAANEMKERVAQIVGSQAEGMWLSTFHSMCVRILRREAELIGYDRSFSIIDQNEQRTLMKRIVTELNYDTKQYDPRNILNHVSQAKNDLLTPNAYIQENTSYMGEVVYACYKAYQKALKESQSMDFDDLIMKTVHLFQSNDDVLMRYQQKFQYIHVDEYQDTNTAQNELVYLLGQGLRNICVVGDADQSIYGWRGAKMGNMLNFEKTYPDSRVILLEQNYRSTQTILDAANSVIKNNLNRKPKTLWTDNQAGEKIQVYVAQSETDEAYHVIESLQTLMKEKNYQWGDFAVLYRTNAQSRAFEDAFLRSNINYRLIGGQRFFDRKEIRDILAYLKLVVNPGDNISFNRVVNEPKRGLGAVSLGKLYQFADQQQVSYLEAAEMVDSSIVGAKAVKNLHEFAEMIAALKEMSEILALPAFIQEVMQQTGYQAALEKEATLESENRLENLNELLTAAEQFTKQLESQMGVESVAATSLPSHLQEEVTTPVVPTSEDEVSDDMDLRNFDLSIPEASPLVQFLTDLALVADNETDEEIDSDNQVTLMTLHAAKGLEFPVVFLVGLEEGIFPSYRTLESEEELEEERRLAYVGITRAEQRLFLSRARQRMLFGKTQSNRASRFLNELDRTLLDDNGQGDWMQSTYGTWQEKQAGKVAKTGFAQRQETRFMQATQPAKQTPSASTTYQLGDKVNHKKWGTGTIVKVTGESNDQQIDVAFKGMGIKRLLANFAPLEKL
ncbi:UvrD-helicase domain-containing protein [Atopobacter phocae]|uniref:UvrD-helicase domain-containing protein n=1 Tax=Atopobacter phocae TaxID=136492 RepID=UPI0005550A5E|nr:UvrD-helicase domain-containing protein [Atopobacter phocae]